MVFFFYNVTEQIEKARDLYSLYGRDLLENEKCSSVLNELNAAIEESRQLMKELGVVDICSACAEEKKGGCCHFGIETCYTDMIILINLLFDVKIPEQRKLENNCLFVDENGCRLKARFKTCIHHLCPKIINSLCENDLLKLRAVNTYEIKLTAQAESAIRGCIRESG